MMMIFRKWGEHDDDKDNDDEDESNGWRPKSVVDDCLFLNIELEFMMVEFLSADESFCELSQSSWKFMPANYFQNSSMTIISDAHLDHA